MKRSFFIVLLISLASTGLYCQQWKQYADSGKMYRDQKDYDSAIIYYTESKNILLKDSLLTDTYIRIAGNLADIYLGTNNFDSAEVLYLQIKKATEALHGKDAGDASVADKLGRLYATKGDYKNAGRFYEEAKAIKESVFTKQSIEYAGACTFLANVFTSTGQYDKAEALYLEGKNIREKLLPKDSAGYAQLCNNLASLYRLTGRYEKAEVLALKAKEIRATLLSGKDSSAIIAAYAISCTNLANLYREMGQYEKAEALYIEGKNIRERIPPYKQSPAYASSCNILADLYYFMGKYKQAEALYTEAKQIREQVLTKENADYAQSCNNLANLYRETGNYKDAESLALEAKEIWDKLLDPFDPNIANNLENLGLIYNQTKRYQQAATFFLQARNIWQKIVSIHHPSYATNAFYLGETYWKLNDNTKANNYFTEAIDAQYDQLKKVFQFTNESEKELYLQNVKDPADEYQSFYFSTAGHTNAAASYAINLSNRNLILSATEQVKQIINNAGDTELNKKYAEWMDIKNQLGALYLKNDTGIAAKISTLEEKAGAIEKELVKNSSALQNVLQKEITWQAIRQSLRPDEAAIEFAEFNFYNGTRWTDSTYYIALLLRKDKAEPLLIQLFEKKQLDSLLNEPIDDNEKIAALYTRGITISRLNTGSRSLYKLLWDPLEKHLAGIKKIYFAPAGDLFKISFAALPVNNTEVLSDKYQLVQLNTTASVTDKKQDFITAGDKIQLYGGIEYTADTTALKEAASAYHATISNSGSLPEDLARSGNIQYLPATKTEVEAIQQDAGKLNMQVNVLSGINATEESFRALSGKASPAILHIATHGFFFPDPKEDKRDSIAQKFETGGKVFKQSADPLFRSGLLFAGAGITWQGKNITGIEDGIVTAYDVSNMYLPNTKLVVLSACETALGDVKGSEGVYGLQRAFKIAGVQNLVMSLWKVPDEETSAFMQLFYDNMFNNQSVSDAFYHAQTTMKNKYRNQPYKWAAWILVK